MMDPWCVLDGQNDDWWKVIIMKMTFLCFITCKAHFVVEKCLSHQLLFFGPQKLAFQDSQIIHAILSELLTR